MSEAQTRTKPKRMVNRKLAFALGLVCIVLIVFIAYFTVTGISAQNSYTSLQNQNKQLQAWLDGNATLLSQIRADNVDLTRLIAEQNNTISQLESNITDLIDRSILISTVKIASVTMKVSGHSMSAYRCDFTVQVKNNGTETVNGVKVVIRLFHDWMNIICSESYTVPVYKYTNEVQDYLFHGNILHFGAIPAGGNETQSISIWVFDQSIPGLAVPINYAVATVFLGNIALDKQTL